VIVEALTIRGRAAKSAALEACCGLPPCAGKIAVYTDEPGVYGELPPKPNDQTICRCRRTKSKG
jgi:hypothetical protein